MSLSHQVDVLGEFHRAEELMARECFIEAKFILEMLAKMALPHPQGLSHLLGVVHRRVSDRART